MGISLFIRISIIGVTEIGRMVKKMIEKYIQFKIFFEYKLPLIVLGIIVAIIIILSIVGKIIDAWEKRQKRYIDKKFSEEEGADESKTEV